MIIPPLGYSILLALRGLIIVSYIGDSLLLLRDISPSASIDGGYTNLIFM